MSDDAALEGVIINLNAYGAVVRLDDGRLASASAEDVTAHRPVYARSLERGTPLAFELRGSGARPSVALIPQLRDDALEARIADYERDRAGWEPEEGPPAHERHFLQKKRRAALFASRHRQA